MEKNNIYKKDKNSLMAKLSIVCVILTIIYLFGITVYDINAGVFSENKDAIHNEFKISMITVNILLVIDILGVMFGVLSIKRKEIKKKLAFTGIILNSLLPASIFISIFLKLT